MTPARILIVEDEALVAEDLQQRLTELGHEVVGTVMAGEEVLRICEETGPDLVLMDIRLRGAMDGITAAEQLRARFHLPVIYVTAYFDDAVLERARKTEPLGYIVKPLRRVELKVTLEMALHQRRLETRLRAGEEQMAAIGQLAGGLAHDFNNLMTTVRGYSEILLDKWPTDYPDRFLVEQIHRAAQHTELLIQRLTAFARQGFLQLEVLDLNMVIDKLRVRLGDSLPGRMALTVSLAPEPMMVNADPVKLEDLLANILVNRLATLHREQTLTIQTGRVLLSDAFARLHPEVKPGQYVEVTIVDAAHELTPDELRHFFEPTLKLKEDARVGTGKGLAMAAAYGTVRQMGGLIIPLSAPGRGTTLRVLLPEHRAEQKAG